MNIEDERYHNLVKQWHYICKDGVSTMRLAECYGLGLGVSQDMITHQNYMKDFFEISKLEKEEKKIEYDIYFANNKRKIVLKYCYNYPEKTLIYIDYNLNIKVNSYKKLSFDEISKMIKRQEKKLTDCINNAIRLKNNQFMLFGEVYNKEEYSENEIIELYKKSVDTLKKIAFDFEREFEFPKTKIEINDKKIRYWAMCYSEIKKIVFNKNSLRLPLNGLKHLIIHEYCHYYYQNHSKHFWGKVSIYDPNYSLNKKEIDRYERITPDDFCFEKGEHEKENQS